MTTARNLAAFGTVSGQQQDNRNLLYNGAMQVAQRGTSTAGITTQNYYTADRWLTQINSVGAYTQSIENDAPTESGFRKSLKMLVTTADATPGADYWLFLTQSLEGQDLQRIAKGTSSASPLTLSFWIKSNKLGTYVVRLGDADNSREVAATYTVNASGTWERKTVTFPADATGIFDNDNAGSLALNFMLGIGSNRSSGTLPISWASTVTANMAPGQTNLAAATNNYWQVTGVQLETGVAATPFEFKSYAQELRDCQRYYYRVTSPDQYGVVLPTAISNSATAFNALMNAPVPMRTQPIGVEYSGIYYAQRTTTSADVTVTSLSISSGSNMLTNFAGGAASGLTANHSGSIRAGVAGAYVGVSAEL